MTKRIIIAALLLASTVSAAPKAPKRHFDYLVCTVEAGKVHVWETSKTAAAAMDLADLLDRAKANGGAEHFVIVNESSKYEAPAKRRTMAQCADLSKATDTHDELNDPSWVKACLAGEVLP